MIDRYAVFSQHARARLKECQLSISKASWYLYQAVEEKLPKDLLEAKSAKYRNRALYLRYGTMIFTLLPIKDRESEEEAYLVVSVYDQRMDLI